MKCDELSTSLSVNPMRARIFQIVSILALCLFATGCLMDSTPPPPPFRIATYGPGLDIESKGKLFPIVDKDGNAQGRVRATRQSMYLQWPNAQGIGSIRLTQHGHAFLTPAGQELCTNQASSYEVQCANTSWTAGPKDKGVRITQMIDGEKKTSLVEANDPNTILAITVGGRSWSPEATVLLQEAYTKLIHNTDDIHEFAAYALLAWSLRDHDSDLTGKRTH